MMVCFLPGEIGMNFTGCHYTVYLVSTFYMWLTTNNYKGFPKMYYS